MFQERRKKPRTTGQRVRFWTRRVVKNAMIAYIIVLLTFSALTAIHKRMMAIAHEEHQCKCKP